MKIEYPDELFTEEELRNTPDRVKRFINEWTESNDFIFTVFSNEHNITGMIMLKDIPFNSLCSHHLLPFKGIAHVAYIPDKVLCGVSKLARAVDKFAHRPQMQEVLTAQIADFLMKETQGKGVMVVMEATHDCMVIRGIKKPGTKMVTSELRGVFDNPPKGKNPREEFLGFINNGK